MALKHKIAQLTDVAEAIRDQYEAGSDGAFYLQVEGMVPKTQIDEFRNKNIELMRENEKFKKDYEGVDIAEYRTLLASKGKTPEQIEDAVKARVKQMGEEHAAALAERDTKINSLSGQLNTVLVDGTLKSEAAKAGVLPTALDDIVYRGRTVFQTVDGKLIAKNDKGEQLYDKDGTSPLAVGSWLKDLKKNAPHLFAGMSGGGAGGNGGQGGKGGLPANATSVQKIQAGLAALDAGG